MERFTLRHTADVDAAWLQHAGDLGEGARWRMQVFEYCEREHHVEALVTKRKRVTVGEQIRRITCPIAVSAGS
jgi:hypothetical protein